MKGKKGFQKKELNPFWKGKDVGYKALHQWVHRYLDRPTECNSCGNVGKVDLANISGKYLRDLKDWEWLCRRCHMNKDGRINNLKLRPLESLKRDNLGRFI